VHWNGAPGWPTASGYIHYQANYQLIADSLAGLTVKPVLRMPR